MRKRNEKHAQNVTKRGNVVLSSGTKNTSATVGPVLLGFFLFVVVGSAILQIIQSASQGKPVFSDGGVPQGGQ